MQSQRYQRLKEDPDEDFSKSRIPSFNQRVIGLACCAFASLVILAAFLSHFYNTNDFFSENAFASDILAKLLRVQSSQHNDPKQCPSPLPPSVTPLAPINPWASLTVPETVAIQSWLEAPKRNLNLTRADRSVTSDNVIFMIEAYHPPKANVLAYLASPETVPPPVRYSRITIHHGAASSPVIKDYLLGPLPLGPKSTLKPLTEIYHRNDIPFHARGLAALTEFSSFWAHAIPGEVTYVVEQLLDGTTVGDNATLIGGLSAPFSFDGSFRRLWVTWRRNVAGPYLHPYPLSMYIDMSGTDPASSKLYTIVYNQHVFRSSEAFVEAFHNGTLTPLPRNPEKTRDFSWTKRDRVGQPRDLGHLPGPRSVSFAGLRFRVDRARQYVSWMGWDMYIGFDRDMGMSLYNIRLKGERIIYQLAPQEALAQYAGKDPVQVTTAWLDRYFGMGSLVRDMLPGYDCPHEAVYLPATTYSSLGSITQNHAICIFEQDTGKPISRHYGDMDGEFGAVKGYTLTIRSISTVGNYDYIVSYRLNFDYTFQLDGTIEVRVSASGYLQSGYWEPYKAQYGTRIRDYTMGSLHDHMMNFKVDFDIAGVKNSFLRTTTVQEEVEQDWLADDWGTTVIQQKIIKDFIDNENDALVKYPTNFQGSYAIVNKEENNSWGYPRGYAIHPGYNAVHNTVIGSKRVLNNANWARYNLAVSRRKETEPTSSSMWNLHLPGAPMVDFHNFFDGEDLTQEDLVAWINVGMHHLPQAEDSPTTKTNLATSSFLLTPLNYFDSDISMDSMNAILLRSPEKLGAPYTFDDNGVNQGFNCVPEAPVPFTYTGLEIFDANGNKAPPRSAEEVRQGAEMYHRIKF